MSGSQDVALGQGSVGRLMLRLSLPTIASQLVNMLYNLVDRVYIGHMPPVETVGKLALTGVGVCLPIILIISAFSALLAAGGAPLASIAEGRGEREKAQRIMGNCFLLLLIAALVLTVALHLYGERLLLLFGASAQTVGYGADYLKVYCLGTLFVQLTLGMNAYITAQGYTTVSMKTVLIGAVLNILLDPLFIFVLGLGVRGAALATVLSQTVSCLWVLRFLTSQRSQWRLRRQDMRLEPAVFLPCVALGLAPFIMQSTESLIALCFNSSLQRYGGDIAVGSMAVLSSIMQLAMMPLMGLTQGAQPLISYNFGARNAQRVRQSFRLLLGLCLGYSLLFWLLVQLLPHGFVGIFTPDPELQGYAAWAIRIYMGATGLFGIQIACQQTFVALGNAKTSLFLAVLRKLILLIPLIYLLPHLMAEPVLAVLLAEPVADLLAVCTTAALFFVQFRQSMAALEAPPSGA